MTLNFILRSTALFEQTSVVTMLTVSIIFFMILLILGVRKSYKLRKENDRLSKQGSKLNSLEDNKTYKDFTDGHLYE